MCCDSHNPDPAREIPPGSRAAGLASALKSRRGFLSLGLLFAAGCATPNKSTRLPDPVWPELKNTTPTAPTTTAVKSPKPKNMTFILDREGWCPSSGTPAVALMNPMLPVKYITVHHDGMSPFLAKDERSSAARLELIRTGHRGKGWGDIGYHYVVDRGGRVWEARDIKWQGAHVKDCNEGNLGICCLGNFDEQSPSPEQIAALEKVLNVMMNKYGVSVSRVKTHQEWASAHTACPGQSLQSEMRQMRMKRLTLREHLGQAMA
ncbi:MAG: peptidoglycan recognition protein family protein [Planctomycetes bacterium]|nr:peptidoglycan recognition protein family protein [Planctomycetota bacterium]